MLSEEAWVGAKVRVSNVHGKPDLRGMTGVVEQMYGHPDYRALEVRLENGRCELFWHYELKHESGFHDPPDGDGRSYRHRVSTFAE